MRRATDHGTAAPEAASEPRFWPVIRLATGRVVGAELVLPAYRAGAAPVPVLAHAAARAFAFGPAATEPWWLAMRLQPGQVGSVLRASGLPPDRLRLQVTEAELSHAVRTGSTAALAAQGVHVSVVDFGSGGIASTALRASPIASVQVSLAGLDRHDPGDVSLLRSVVAVAASMDIEVLGHEVESDDQLALAAEAGIALVQGYRWGSAGPLAKLVATWARQGVSG